LVLFTRTDIIYHFSAHRIELKMAEQKAVYFPIMSAEKKIACVVFFNAEEYAQTWSFLEGL